MTAIPTPRTEEPARSRVVTDAAAERAHLLAALEAAIFSLLATLLGWPSRAATWHPAAPAPGAPRSTPFLARHPSDGTHLPLASPILYVLGPGPGTGLRPHPRAKPDSRPRLARAPPPHQPSARLGRLGRGWLPALIILR